MLPDAFEISVPEGGAPVIFRPHRINPILDEEADATLNQSLAADLIQHSTSPHSSPLMLIPKESGGVRITVMYRKLSQISKPQPVGLPPRGPCPGLFGQETGGFLVRPGFFVPLEYGAQDTVPLAAFCTPTGLYEWLVMPQGSSPSPGRSVKVISEVIKGLEQVATYLVDVIVFDSDPFAHVRTTPALFERLHKHNLKLSPSKARLGAAGADFLIHSISPAGVCLNAEKASALIKIPMPRDLKQVCSLLGGVGYFRKFLRELSSRSTRSAPSSGRELRLSLIHI